MTELKAPIVRVQMLILKPVGEVFEAFVDPAITTRFWLTKSTGTLEAGKTLQWEWGMHGVTVPVTVMTLDRGTRILIEWGDPPCPAEWQFSDRGDSTTLASISS